MTAQQSTLYRQPMRIAGLIAVSLLAACASFHDAPLPASADLAPAASRLKIDASRLRLGPLRARRFDPSAGLDPTDVAILAVLNSPELAAKRAASKVAAAQAFSAGLLPDPQVVLSLDIPDHPAGLVTAYGVTPSLDLMSLITHSTALRAARASADQADLDLLWSEWSTAQQARILAVTVLADEAKARVLVAIFADLAERYRQSSLALARGDITSVVASADLAAELDAKAQLAVALHDEAKARGDLGALIGLAPTVRLNLVEGPLLAEPEPAAMDAALASVASRRPDLLALQAGYRSQNANLRKAILTQFPLLNFGFSRQRDTGGILTGGPTATVAIPLFNRGRGDIAIQSATRERLRAEYQARLDQTVADVAAARRDLEADRANLAILEADVPRLAAVAAQARAALVRGDLDSAAYLALEQSALRQQVAIEDLRLALRLAEVSLQTTLFLPAGQEVTP